MAPALVRLLKFFTKAGLAGGAVYVAYDQGLMGRGEQGEEVLKKMNDAVPPAIQEWADYFGWQIPSTPKFDFSVRESWNWADNSGRDKGKIEACATLLCYEICVCLVCCPEQNL
ncbi:hypothetical protein GDO86_001121 [Hymenochirus boettgeri]|uniref:MICOS complex subunit MIC13 n=1 Tax=Hymenochirus boettgeri TaxID=247094 RepID=A0A8T2KK74_9PIPI|nr:hypothetical protein GDO86_001121 [Hymenochirus boettgeri]